MLDLNVKEKNMVSGGSTIQVIGAIYGGYEYKGDIVPKNCITTSKIAELCNGEYECSVAVNNDLCGGDPYPGHKKRLVVGYLCDGIGWLAQADEGEIAVLSCAGKGSCLG